MVCILLIVPARTVASLLLARGAARVREMAVRAAVGASRGELIRQLLVESSLLAIGGAALGIPLALFAVELLIVLDPLALPRAQDIHLDATIVGFSFLLALATALIFGIVPALRGSRVGLRDALTEGGRGGSGGRSANRLRSALVVIEAALGVVLLASAGLLARSFQRLIDVYPGYDSANVVTMQIALSDVRHRDIARCEKFFERVINQLEQTPGVASVGTTNLLPLVNIRQTVGIWLDSQPVQPAGYENRARQSRGLPRIFSRDGCSSPGRTIFRMDGSPRFGKSADRQRCVRAPSASRMAMRSASA